MGFMDFWNALFAPPKVETTPAKEEEPRTMTPKEASQRLKNLPTKRFDFSDVYYVNRKYGPLMMIDEKNAEVVNGDIAAVNELLERIKKKKRCKIKPIPTQEYSPNGTYITVAPLTKMGKEPKYPFSVNFGDRATMLTGDSMFGDFFYLADGTLGKAKYIRWYELGKGYEIDFGLVGTTLSVLRIDRLGELKPVRLYDYKSGGQL